MSEILIDFERRLTRLEAVVNGCSEVSSYSNPIESHLQNGARATTSSHSTKKRTYEKTELMKLRGVALRNNYDCPSSLRQYNELKTEISVPMAVSRVISFDPQDREYLLSTKQEDIGDNSIHCRYPIIYSDADLMKYSRRRDEKSLKYSDDKSFNCSAPLNAIMTSAPSIFCHKEQAGKSARKKNRGVDHDLGHVKGNGKVEYQYGLVVRSPRDN